MGASIRNLYIAAVLLVATFTGTFCSAPAQADGTLIVGATPPFDPYMNESESITLTVYAVSNHTATIQWVVDGTRQNSTVTNFVYRPDYQSAGDHNITAIVNTTNITDSHTWTVHVMNRDEPLYITGWEPAGDAKMLAGESQKFSVTYSNPDSDPLTIQWLVNGGLALGANRSEFTFLAGTNLSGVQVISLFISDGLTSRTLLWNLTVEVPIMASPSGAVRVTEGDVQAFRVLNKDGQTFTWSVDSQTMSETGPVFTYRPGFTTAGNHNIAVSLADGTRYSWSIVVTNNLQAPVVSEGRYMEAMTGESVKLTAIAYDIDGNVTRFQWDFNEDGNSDYESFTSPNTTHAYSSPGQYQAILKVTDSDSLVSSTVFTILVKEKKATFNWWIPAVFMGILVLLMLFIVAIQARRISRTKEEMSKKAFYAEKAAKAAPPEDDEPKFRDSAPVPEEAKPVEKPKKEPPALPPEVQKPEEEPELLQVKPSLGDKGMDGEVKHAGPDTEIAISQKKPDKDEKKEAPKESKRKSDLDDIITTLLDKGAEGDARASETELSSEPGSRRPRKDEKKDEPKPAETAPAGLKDKKAEGEASSEDTKDVPEMKKKKVK